METQVFKKFCPHSVLLLSYLWGMETASLRVVFTSDWSLLSYLWGMETNIYPLYHTLFSSYPTHEEWKLWNLFGPQSFSLFLSYLWGMKQNSPHGESFSALSYLWGMETFFIRVRISRFLSALILPMRNGNKESLRKLRTPVYPTYEEWKQVMGKYIRFLKNGPYLPMRNGNRYKNKTKSAFVQVYPTYEEWKPMIFISSLDSQHRSYPTYEEWKL